MAQPGSQLIEYMKTNKTKEKADMILEPLQVMITLAQLNFYPIGTKIKIYKNVLYLHEPSSLQGLFRWLEGERMSKEITTLQEQKNSAFQMAFKDYDEKLTKKEEIWESKLIKQREDYETKLSEEQKERQKLLLRGQNSTIIGQDGENFTLHELTRMFPKAEIEDTHKERGRGDFIFKEKECSMLVETKNYKSNVTKPEIEKFYRDIDINNDINCGVIISLKSGICARDDFQLEVRGGKPILFLHNISGNISNLGLAVKLFKLILKPGTIDLTCKETTDKITNIIPIIKRNMNLMKQKLQKFNTEMLECTNAQESLLKELIAVLGSSY